MMFWYGGSWAWWEAGLMWVLMIAFWALIAWLIYYFVVSSMRDSHRRREGPSTRQILDERLAKGEIDVDEYRRLRDILDGSDRPDVGARR